MKDLAAYPTHNKYRDGVTKVCWDCYRPQHRAYQKRYRATARGRAKVAGYKLQGRYGISKEQYDEMVKRQRGLCAICGHAPKKKALGVDHNHSTGCVRLLLCDPCNKGLGHFRDDAALLERAADYLRSQ